MPTVFQCLNSTSSPALGPVKITKAYPPEAKAGGKPRRNLYIQDDSGKTKLTLWGAASNLPLSEGSTVTFKGKIARNEYPKGSGQVSLAAEEVTVESGGAPAGGAPRQQSFLQEANAAKPVLNVPQLAKAMAEFTVEYQQALIAAGASKEFAEKASLLAPQFAAQWFHGEKYPIPGDDFQAEEDGMPDDDNIPY